MPDPLTEGFAERTVAILSDRKARMYLLGSALAALLLDMWATEDVTDQVVALAEELTKAIGEPSCIGRYAFIDVSLHVRSHLFWRYFESDRRKSEFVRRSSDLIAACLASAPERALEAELILSHRTAVLPRSKLETESHQG